MHLEHTEKSKINVVVLASENVFSWIIFVYINEEAKFVVIYFALTLS